MPNLLYQILVIFWQLTRKYPGIEGESNQSVHVCVRLTNVFLKSPGNGSFGNGTLALHCNACVCGVVCCGKSHQEFAAYFVVCMYRRRVWMSMFMWMY